MRRIACDIMCWHVCFGVRQDKLVDEPVVFDSGR